LRLLRLLHLGQPRGHLLRDGRLLDGVLARGYRLPHRLPPLHLGEDEERSDHRRALLHLDQFLIR
jgi:hypothetical protein